MPNKRLILRIVREERLRYSKALLGRSAEHTNHAGNRSRLELFEAAGDALEAVARLLQKPLHDASHVVTIRNVIAQC